jgi:hypothetical protein
MGFLEKINNHNNRSFHLSKTIPYGRRDETRRIKESSYHQEPYNHIRRSGVWRLLVITVIIILQESNYKIIPTNGLVGWCGDGSERPLRKTQHLGV